MLREGAYLLLLGGQEGAGSLAHCAAEFGWRTVRYDVELDPEGHDLACDVIWSKVMADLRARKYGAAIFSPPWSTFSSERASARNDWVRPLRMAAGPELYGRKDLKGADKERCRL